MCWPAPMLPKEIEEVIMVKVIFHSNPRDQQKHHLLGQTRLESKGQTEARQKTYGDSSKQAFCCSSPPAVATLRAWSVYPGSPPRILPYVFCYSHIKSISRDYVSTASSSDDTTGKATLTRSCLHQDTQSVSPCLRKAGHGVEGMGCPPLGFVQTQGQDLVKMPGLG